MRLRVDVDTTGPLFDGRALAAIRDYVDEVPLEVARRGLWMWLAIYRGQVQNPTPYYEHVVTAERVRRNESHLWDGGQVVYGPWLEGVGSRNFPVTRFRGYFSMRKTTPKMDRAAVPIANALWSSRYQARVN